MIISNLFAVWKKRESDLGRRITYSEVSQATGISPTTLTRWMNGSAQRFGAETLDALGKFFDRPATDLLVDVAVESTKEE